MTRKKESVKYLDIPENFKGFTYKEIKLRRTMLDLKREVLRDKMKSSLDEIREEESERKGGKMQNMLSLGVQSLANVTSGKFGAALKIATVGMEAYNFIKKYRTKRKAKKLKKQKKQ